jgi:hypothetical protein
MEDSNRLTIKVSTDTKMTAIDFPPQSNVTGTLNLNQAELLETIQALGTAHAALLASSPLPLLEGQDIDAVINTRWYIQPELLSECSVISFLHPSFGPLGFAIPRDQLPLMVDLLSKHLDIQPQSSGLPN